jgi:hypothetical protein
MKKQLLIGTMLLGAVALAQTLTPNPRYSAFAAGQTWVINAGAEFSGRMVLNTALKDAPFVHPSPLFTALKKWSPVEGEITSGSSKGSVQVGFAEGLTAVYAKIGSREHHCVFLMPSRGGSIRGGGYVFKDQNNPVRESKENCTLTLQSDPKQSQNTTPKPDIQGPDWFKPVMPDLNTVWRLEAFNYRFELWFDRVQPNGFTGDVDMVRGAGNEIFNDWTFRLHTLGPTAWVELSSASYNMTCDLSLGTIRGGVIASSGTLARKNDTAKEGPCRILTSRQ